MRKGKGQILVESAFYLPVMLAMVFTMIASAYVYAQHALVVASLPVLCELYAESPDIQGPFSASIPYLFIPGSYVPLPRVSFVLSNEAGQTLVSLTSDENHRLHLVPIDHQMSTGQGQYHCQISYSRSICLPFVGCASIESRKAYSTVRRYGSLGEKIRFPFPGLFLPGLLVRKRRIWRKARGNALIEYALVSVWLLPFLVSIMWGALYIAEVTYTSSLGTKSAILAALGDNVTDIAMSFGSCSFGPGDVMDCNGKSPYSAAAANGTVPCIVMGDDAHPLSVPIRLGACGK